jgi:hypothetical protein
MEKGNKMVKLNSKGLKRGLGGGSGERWGFEGGGLLLQRQ